MAAATYIFQSYYYQTVNWRGADKTSATVTCRFCGDEKFEFLFLSRQVRPMRFKGFFVMTALDVIFVYLRLWRIRFLFVQPNAERGLISKEVSV